MKRILAVVAAVLIVVGAVHAQCRVIVRSPVPVVTPVCQPVIKPIVHQAVVPVVHRPTVAIPIAIPVAVPATVFQYMPAVQPTYQPAVPISQAVPSQPPASADIDKMVRDRVDQILRERSNDSGPPALLMPDQSPPLATSSENLDTQVANLLSTKSCVQCHTGGRPVAVKGNVTLFVQKGDDLFFQPTVTKQKILDAVSDNPRMPPNALGNPNHPDALRPPEIALLQRWVAAR